MNKGYATTPLGQLHYAEAGNGTPVLLLHQTPRSFDEFAEVLPLLATSHRAIAMDMLGFGSSAPEPGRQSIAGMAAGALALLDALGIEQAHVLGHHTGGAVAIEVAASAPERVLGLVLSSAPWTDSAYRLSHAGGDDGVDVAQQAADGSHLTQLWSLRSPYYPTDRPDLLDRFIRDALSPGVDPSEGHLACARYIMEDRIGLVRAPTLLIGADSDPFAFPAIEPLSKNLTGVERLETAVVEGGMIPLMEVKADEVVAVVEPFLRSVELTVSTSRPTR